MTTETDIGGQDERLRSARSRPVTEPACEQAATEGAEGSGASILARLDDIEVKALAWRHHAERLRAAITWLEAPFVDDGTTEGELRTRIGLMVIDAVRSDAAIAKALGASA